MKVIAVNGSPRKNWNTATLLQKSLEGAASRGAETKIFHLYELDYKGCISCFACKTKEGKSYGRCAVKDDLALLLKEVEDVDAIILGSPIYYGSVTGAMRSFMERLLYPYSIYTAPPGTLFPRKIRTGFIYTLNASEEMTKKLGHDRHFAANAMLLERIFGPSEMLCSYDTYQFEDYSKVVAPRFDPLQKARRRADVFPLDCENAFAMGARMVN
ncbi:MAG: flavodoxin family protein [Deltaproteobacteria bacterium]|nr:flavodoxin family protein [Deltaproteobacteria bacterium]